MQAEIADSAVTSETRLLVVDDDPAVADLTREFFEREQTVADVIVRTDPEEALAAISDRPALDGVVCDFDMPGMDGLDVCEAVRERRPGLAFVLFTGSGDHAFGDRPAFDAIDAFVQKSGQGGLYGQLVDTVLDVVED